MRIKHSVNRFFMTLVVPAMALAVVGYFGGHVIWGERGLLKLGDMEVRLGIERETLLGLRAQQDRLVHHVRLMEAEPADPDLVEELARGRLMDGAPGQVAISRTAR